MPVPARDELASSLLRLRGHPIFSANAPSRANENQVGSTSDARTGANASDAPGFLAQKTLCTRDGDLIVAVDREIRMMPIPNFTGLAGTTAGLTVYKKLAVPNLDFEILQMEMNENGRLLAVAGLHEIVVVILPREGYVKAMTESIQCRGVNIGPYHYSNTSASKVAKIGWHPWGLAASTLLVLTDDGALREFDISSNPEVPLQTFNALPTRRGHNTFNAGSDFATSFTLGSGKADWGPMTLYILTGDGDVYAICPYLPFNAQIPLDYLESLHSLVQNRQTYLDSQSQPTVPLAYDEQSKFLQDLKRQATSHVGKSNQSHGIREALIRGRHSLDKRPIIQGPFLLQPSPLDLDGEGGAATDIVYINCPDSEGSIAGGAVNIVVIAFQDGKVDICLDVIKVEPRWSIPTEQVASSTTVDDSPMLLVFESIDLGLSHLGSLWIERNCPQVFRDQLHPEIFYVYHGAGVHCISTSPWVPTIRAALSKEPKSLTPALEKASHSEIGLLRSTRTASDEYHRIVGVVPIVNLNLPLVMLALSSKPEMFPFIVKPPVSPPLPKPESLVLETAVPKPQLLPPSRAAPLRSSQTDPDITTVPYSSLLSVEGFSATPVQYPTTTVPRQNPLEHEAESLKRLKAVRETILNITQDLTGKISKVETRIELQEMERSRQAERVQELLSKYGELQDNLIPHLHERMRRLTAKKDAISAKARRLTTTLQQSSTPKLSASEREWFAELKETNEEVGSIQSHSTSSLFRRKVQLDTAIAIITGRLRDTKLADNGSKSIFSYSSPRPSGWGTDQLNRYVKRLQYLQKEVGALQNRTESMLNSL